MDVIPAHMLPPSNYNVQYSKFYVHNNPFYSVVDLILEQIDHFSNLKVRILYKD